MSIKNRGEKYVEILNFLRREYVKKFGKEAEGLSDTMLKRQAAEQVDEMMKVIPFPEKNITDWTKERPKTGPKADVKKFPTKNKPAAQTYSSDFLDLLEEMEKLGQPYKDTSVSDFMSDYFDMPKKSKTPATDKMQKMLGDVKLYGDETFDELQIIKDTGKHPRNKAAGGRVKYENGSDPKSYDVPTESPLKISGNFSKSKKSEILDYVASLEIPVSEKIKLIGELTGVNSSFKDEYGKYKYQDLMKSVGLNYNEGGEGLSAAFRHNVDTGENDAYFQYKMPFAKGGRIGYAEGMSAEEAVAGRLPPNYKFLEDADLKRSPEGIVMEGYQDTTTLDMLRDALKKQERRTPLVEYEDGTIYYPDFDEYYNDDGKQVEGPAFWAKPIPKLFEVPKHSERKSIDLANGGRIGFKFGTKKRGDKIKSIIEEVNKKLKTKTTGGEVKLTVDIPESPKAELQRMFDEFNKRFKEKTKSYKQGDPITSENFGDTPFAPDLENLKKARGTYGSGEDLYKILKSEGITINQAVKEALADMARLSGDAKYDAEAVAEVVYQKLDIDPYTLNQYHVLDVYDKAYNLLKKNKKLTPKESFLKQYFAKKQKEKQEMYKDMYQKAADDSLKKMDPEAETYAKELEYDVQEKISEPGYRGVVTEANDLDDTLKIIESQKSEATKLREQYPGISEALLNKIVKDNNPQRKAEVLASLDEVLTMMDKGMDQKQIMDVLRKTTRTKNASGGLNYLMGL
jgi:hypothetical protein